MGASSIRSPPFLISEGGRKEGRGERKGGSYSLYLFPPPLLLSPLRPAHMGRTSPLGSGMSRPWPNKVHIFAGGCPEPLSVTRYVPGTPRTLLVSEYYRPIYEYLPIDHFETPRHVLDLIRDSKQTSVIKSHNSYNIKSSSNVKRADPTGSRTM